MIVIQLVVNTNKINIIIGKYKYCTQLTLQ